MKALFFVACGAGILYAVSFVAYCVSKRVVKDAVSVGVLVVAATAAAVWLAAVS